MTRPPLPETAHVADILERSYGITVSILKPISGGLDSDAVALKANCSGGETRFVKLTLRHIEPGTLALPLRLREMGIKRVVAPLRSVTGALSESLGPWQVIVYPFVSGRLASEAGMTREQWRDFGKSLRAVHERGVAGADLPVERFDLECAGRLRELIARVEAKVGGTEEVDHYARSFLDRRPRYVELLLRAELIATRSRMKSPRMVLCHSDIHSANVLVGDDGYPYLIDWDMPKVGPVELDLQFIVGSRIARTVEPAEEIAFFEGYGDVVVDTEMLAYCRYVRVIEDVYQFGIDILFDPALDADTRALYQRLSDGYFLPDELAETAEIVTPHSPRVRVVSD